MDQTVLLVEDDPNDNLLMTHAFRREAPHLRLRLARDGEEALAYLAGTGPYADRNENPFPVLVLLDLKIPRRSGFEVLQWIRKESGRPDLHVFILTSSSESGDMARAYTLGANAYLVKSVDVMTMREIVKGIGQFVSILRESPQAAPAES